MLNSDLNYTTTDFSCAGYLLREEYYSKLEFGCIISLHPKRIMEADIKKEGNLPIKVLAYNILHIFQTANTSFEEELREQITYEGLKPNILYDNGKQAVNNVASISPDRQIILNEPYLAYLWCLSHAVVTFYREQNSNDPDPATNQKLSRAIEVLIFGYSLFDSWSEWPLSLPNPEKYDLNIDPYIEQANGVMLMATRFLLCHEYSHHYLGHPLNSFSSSEIELKEDEFAADEYALDIMLKGVGVFGPQMDETIKLGLVVGISSLLLISDCWKGDDAHPDTDERVYRLIEMLSTDPNSDSWKFGLLILLMWNLAFRKNNTDNPIGHHSVKEDYRAFLKYLKEQQIC